MSGRLRPGILSCPCSLLPAAGQGWERFRLARRPLWANGRGSAGWPDVPHRAGNCSSKKATIAASKSRWNAVRSKPGSLSQIAGT